MRTNRSGYGLIAVLTAFLIISLSAPTKAQQLEGLGYSEGPFELIENPTSAVGETPLIAIENAVATDASTIEQEGEFETDGYVFIAVNIDYIGHTAVALRVDENWQFVCREAGMMPASRMTENCGVPQAVATQLFDGLIDDLSSEE